MSYPESIQEIFRRVVAKAQGYVLAELQDANPNIELIHYHYSTMHEMETKLQNMLEGSNTPSQRFPLVWLNESPPIPQVRNSNGRFADVTLQVWIMFRTEQNYTSPERQELVFDPIIAPIYENLIKAIHNMPEFGRPPVRDIQNTFLDHKFLGTNANAANVFSTFVDAREIRDLQLTVSYNNCITPTFLN